MTNLELFLVIAECFIILNWIVQTIWFTLWLIDRFKSKKLLKMRRQENTVTIEFAWTIIEVQLNNERFFVWKEMKENIYKEFHNKNKTEWDVVSPTGYVIWKWKVK